MTVVQLVNLALLNLGVSQHITSISDGSREAGVATLFYDHVLRYALRRHPWPFATKYLELDLTSGPFWDEDPDELTLVQAWDAAYSYRLGDVVRLAGVNYYCILANTNQTPPNTDYWSTDPEDAPDFANGDWHYTYRWPSDCVYARRIVPPGGRGRQHSDTPIEFRVFRDENGLLIATHQEAAELEYTMVDCVDMWTNDTFLRYFTWELAGAMAPALERSAKTTRECLLIAESYYRIAATLEQNEKQLPKPVDAPWVRAR